MVNILGAEIPVPTFGIGTGNWVWVGIVFVFIIIGFIVAVIILQMLTYNRKIIVFENISGQGFQPVYRDKARLVKLGDGGEELLYLKKKKVYRTAYGKKMGKNTFWFVIGQDGYWYNCVLGDLDAKMGTLDIEPIDRDMRYMHVAVRKNIAERYRKISFMEKHGLLIVSLVFLLVLIGGVWFIVDKMAETASLTNQNIKASGDVVNAAADLLAGLNNVQGGSGLVPAT
jgi:hypothetical protein